MAVNYLIPISVAVGGVLLCLLPGSNASSDIFPGDYYEILGLTGVLALSLAMALGYRLHDKSQNKLSVPKPVSRRTPTVTQIAVLLGILSYATTAQFLGKGVESWFEAHAETTLDGGRSSPGANRPGNNPQESTPPAVLNEKTAYPATSLTPKEDSGAFPSYTAPGLAGMLALGLVVVFGYRFWRLRNKPGSKLFVPKQASCRSPTPTQIAVLLGILSYAVAAQFLDKGIESWFEAHTKTAFDSRPAFKASDPNSPQESAQPPALNEKIAQPPAALASKEDSGTFSLPGNANPPNKPVPDEHIPDKPTINNQAAQPAAALEGEEDSGIFSSYAMLELTGALALGLAVTLGYRFWRLRDKPGSKLLIPKPSSRRALFLVPAAVLLGTLIYAATMQFMGKGIESWFGIRAEKTPDKHARGELDNTLKELAKEPPAPDEKITQQPPLNAKEDSVVFSSSGNMDLPDKPATGKKLAPPLAPSTTKEKLVALSAAGSASLPSKLVSSKPAPGKPVPDKPVAQGAAPLTAKEDPVALVSPDNASLPDMPGGDAPQQVEYKRVPVYRASSRSTKRSRYVFNGSLGVEAENYTSSSNSTSQQRQTLRTRVDLNNGGFIWDPRFLTYNAGVALQKDTTHTSVSNGSNRSEYSTLGYNLNTTWLPGKPYALNLYANRNQSTISVYQSPSYNITSTNMGARWGLDSQWLGRMNFNLNRAQSDANSSVSPRSDRNQSFGVDISKKLFPKQWGESDLKYGYRHSEMIESVSGSKQSQDYLNFGDSTRLGDKMNLRASVSSSNNRNQYGAGSGTASDATSSFLNFNSSLSVQQNENFSHSYSLGMSTTDTNEYKISSQNVSGAASYRFSPQWQTNASLGLSSTNTDTINSASQTASSTSASGGVQYSNKFGAYLVNGGYNLFLSRATSSAATATAQQTTSHFANAGYTRTGSPRYADSLQLRMSQTVGTNNKNSDANVHYGVTSTLSQKDALQGNIDYRLYNSTITSSGILSNSNSNSLTTNMGWQHRFSDTANMTVSLGVTQASGGINTSNYRYAQANTSMLFRGNLQWSALVRMENYESTQSYAGDKLTIESTLDYRIGKWQTGVRYKYGDTRLQLSPFKEQSIFLILKRAYGFDF